MMTSVTVVEESVWVLPSEEDEVPVVLDEGGTGHLVGQLGPVDDAVVAREVEFHRGQRAGVVVTA